MKIILSLYVNILKKIKKRGPERVRLAQRGLTGNRYVFNLALISG